MKKPFLMGAQYTVADSYLYTILRWTGLQKIEIDKWPDIPAYMERVQARPASQKALKEEGLLK
jgi:glutathione S-transferase